MSTVSVREFLGNPSASLARVERGDAMTVTRNGEVIAILLPTSVAVGRYAPLVASGLLRLKATSASNLDRVPHYDVPTDREPLDILLAARAEDDR